MGQPPAEGERSEDQQPSGVQEEVRASMGSSPSHGRGGPPSVHSAAIQAPSTAGVSELSPTDSFIMGVLRGWRLLQAACLNAEEPVTSSPRLKTGLSLKPSASLTDLVG